MDSIGFLPISCSGVQIKNYNSSSMGYLYTEHDPFTYACSIIESSFFDDTHCVTPRNIPYQFLDLFRVY